MNIHEATNSSSHLRKVGPGRHPLFLGPAKFSGANWPFFYAQACFQCNKCMAAAAAVKDAADCLMTMPSLMLEPLHRGGSWRL